MLTKAVIPKIKQNYDNATADIIKNISFPEACTIIIILKMKNLKTWFSRTFQTFKTHFYIEMSLEAV